MDQWFLLQFQLIWKANGSVYAWGANLYGELGDGTTAQRNSPVMVLGLSNVIQISAGYEHSLALLGNLTNIIIYL